MKKKAYVAVCTIILVFVLASCNGHGNGQPTYDAAPTQTTVNAQRSALWVNTCDSVDSFVESADIIVIGRVISKETERRHDYVFTHHEVELLAVYQGDVQEGESITVVLDGGEMDGFITDPFVEIPLLDMGSEYMLFLDYTGDPNFDYYLPTGSYQGVFAIEDSVLRARGIRHDIIAAELVGLSLSSVEQVVDTVLSAKVSTVETQGIGEAKVIDELQDIDGTQDVAVCDK